VSAETVPGLVPFINPQWVMGVLQSAPGAKCGFGRYSRASLNHFRLGKKSALDHLPPRLLWPALAHGGACCPQGLLAGLTRRQQRCEGGRRKLETTLPCKGQFKKIGGQSLVKPPDVYPLLFLFMPWEGQTGHCSQLWSSRLADAPGAALAGLLGLDVAFRR